MKDRYQQVRFVLLVTLLANVFVATSKLIFGVAIQSLSLLADGFHSLLDCTSNIVGLVGIALSRTPPDDKHPYGHRKFETLA
ncbi:MAG TPA: cation transporter, partial [Firmicutes bacterium]|nr:cation transporter [Bacillota bacterium]